MNKIGENNNECKITGVIYGIFCIFAAALSKGNEQDNNHD